MSNITDFEARARYHKRNQLLLKKLKKRRQEEVVIDGLLAAATTCFLTSWLLTTLRVFEIWR